MARNAGEQGGAAYRVSRSLISVRIRSLWRAAPIAPALQRIARRKGAHLRQLCSPLFFDRPFQYFSPLPPCFSQFSAVSPQTCRLRQTGLPTAFFCVFRLAIRPNPAETLETRDSEESQNNRYRNYFYNLSRGGHPPGGRMDTPIASAFAPALPPLKRGKDNRGQVSVLPWYFTSLFRRGGPI